MNQMKNLPWWYSWLMDGHQREMSLDGRQVILGTALRETGA